MAAMPSPLPVSPRPSVVVAATLTGAPTAALRAACASPLRGDSLGRLPMICTDTFAISKPASRTSRAVSASRVLPDAPASSGLIDTEYFAEVAKARRAQERVARRVRGDVAVGVTREGGLVGPGQAREREALLGAKGVDVDATPVRDCVMSIVMSTAVS